MEKLPTRHIKQFQQRILTWYAAHKRDLPWREVPFDTSLQERDPYRILVSEVMLQQTQVSRVMPKFTAWFQAFPTIQDLADASVSEVLRLWSGLGYNRRALYLKKAAEMIAHDFGGKFPRDEKTLRTIPGIGEYTSRAILCFAFNQQVAVVDTNIRKVILTEVLSETKEAKGTERTKDKRIQEIADLLLPKGRAYEWNQALMDYAASELREQKIVIPKQSKFKGSNRYYRGQTIKYLLTYKMLTVTELLSFLQIEREKYEILLDTLMKDGMITRKGEDIALTNT